MHIFWGDIVDTDDRRCATILFLLVENPFVLIDQYFQNARDQRRKQESENLQPINA